MPRVGLNQQAVVREAARLADEVGYQQLTLAALAGRLGVALPSLYKHVRGADELAQKLSALATAELADELTTAAVGRAGVDALQAMASAYRDYAKRHPGRYPATQRAPDPADPEHVVAGERAVGAIYAVLRGYGLTGDDAVDATRALRSALHGFVALELGGGFGLPREVDRSYHQLVASLDTSFRSWPGTRQAADQQEQG
ncbi:WHG domain-containing protein [Micromonospora sp. CPCC 205539]|uniref:TetR/AcrR family transcriptional regulator n=1 Tax=Micromonospora sp. CPCC 205539 TaxID=3122408 RepID=UPI002FF13AA4